MQTKKEIEITPKQYVDIIKRRRQTINEHMKVLEKLESFTEDDCKDLLVLATVVQRMCVMMPENSHEYVESVREILKAAGMDTSSYDKMLKHDKEAEKDESIERSVCGHGTPLYGVALRCNEEDGLYDALAPKISNVWKVFDMQRGTLRKLLEASKSKYISLEKALARERNKQK